MNSKKIFLIVGMIFIVTAMLLTPLAAKEVKTEMLSAVGGFAQVEVPDNFEVNEEKAVSDDCVVEVHSLAEGEVDNFENFWDVANNGAYSDYFSLGDTSKSEFKVYDFTAQKLLFDAVSFAFDKVMPDQYLSDYENARFVYFIHDGSAPSEAAVVIISTNSSDFDLNSGDINDIVKSFEIKR